MTNLLPFCQASGSWDRTVCLWDPFRGNLLKKLTGHSGWIKAVNFSINSIELASTADDDTVSGLSRKQ